MSNVLIGIIGVILFIGLALAGALFLGPRFQQSTNDSKASASVQAVAQLASAMEMYRIQEGRPFGQTFVETGDPFDELVGTYLKSMPVNPTGGGPIQAEDASQFVGRTGSVVIVMDLAGNAESICKAINRQLRGSDTTPDFAVEELQRPGCVKSGSSYLMTQVVG